VRWGGRFLGRGGDKVGGEGLKGKMEGWEVELGDCKVNVGGEELKKAR